jgi:hypothetical protein
VVSGEEETPLGTVFALPVIDAAIGNDLGIGGGIVTPDLAASGGVEGDDCVVVSENIDDAIDDEGVECVVVGVFDGTGPSYF